jgi:hypothetical protein
MLATSSVVGAHATSVDLDQRNSGVAAVPAVTRLTGAAAGDDAALSVAVFDHVLIVCLQSFERFVSTAAASHAVQPCSKHARQRESEGVEQLRGAVAVATPASACLGCVNDAIVAAALPDSVKALCQIVLRGHVAK